MKPENEHLTHRISSIIRTFYEWEDRAASVTDILADLRHYCDKFGLDFADLDRIAYNHYTEEK